MATPGNCPVHSEEAAYNCGWCSIRICDSCVDEAGGKKYCPRCAVRFRMKATRQPAREESAPEKPKMTIIDMQQPRPPKKKGLFGF